MFYFFFFLSSLGLHHCSWAFSSCSMPASHWDGFSCCQAQAIGHGSFSSCGTELSCLSTCNLSRLGIEPVSPVLADRVSNTGSPGKSLFYFAREREERYKPNRSKIHLLEYGSYEWEFEENFDSKFRNSDLIRGEGESKIMFSNFQILKIFHLSEAYKVVCKLSSAWNSLISCDYYKF